MKTKTGLKRLGIQSQILLIPLFGSLVWNLGCTRQSKEDSARVVIQMPVALTSSKTQEAVTAQAVGAFEDPSWNGSILNRADINCYIVMVGTPSGSINSCTSRTGEVISQFGPYEGGVPAGQTIAFDLKSGANHVFYLFGAKASSGACTSFHSGGPNKSLISYFRLLDQQVVNLSVGEQQVALSVPSNLTSLKELKDCTVHGEGGGSNGINLGELFGNGRDGVLTSTGGTMTGASNPGNYSGITQSGQSGITVPTTKNSHSSRAVAAFTNDSTIQTTTTFASDDFEAGDEILWTVISAFKVSGAPDDACGGGLYRGRWGTAKVAAVSGGNTLHLDRSVVQSFGTLNAAAVAQVTIDQSQTFCRILVTRVPSYSSVNLSGNLTISADTLPPAMVSGGIVALRIQNLIFNGTYTLNVTATSKGFQGAGNSTGASPYGAPGIINSSGNELGGGSSATAGGGGGNGGAGGSGSTSEFGGSSVSWCLTHPVGCLAWKDQKAVIGGAGGSSGGNSGTASGGLAFVFIKSTTGSGIITVEADGTATSTANAGAGAGGTSLLMIQTAGHSGLTTVRSLGGSTTGPNTGGGAGGGGVAEFYSCNSHSPSVLAGKGNSVSGAAREGIDGLASSNSNYSPLCQ